MKAVLMSIQPKWCELIANGKKTVEVRKTKPKLETPFKVYIYCTLQGSNEFFQALKNSLGEYEALSKWNRENWGLKKGKVIGEFVCDEILDCRDVNMDDTCLTVEEWLKYTKGHKGVVYGWHISNLVIYDKPRELSEFHTIKKCVACKWTGYESTACIYDEDCKVPFQITRPPQSWCYVESVGDTE